MIGYVDCDFLLKLMACNLFWEVIVHLKLVKENLRVTDSTPYSIGSKKRRLTYTDPVRDRVICCAKDLTTISPGNDPIMSLDLPDLDGGEQMLLCAAISTPSSYLLTGDKRFLRALYQHNALKEARTGLRGRVVCLEQAILGAIALKGFDYVKERIVPFKDCDKALKAAFGSGGRSEQPNTISVLQDYIAEIKQDCPDLLVNV
ncbi:MAG: hypothetical protein HC919_10200 [Oscillatoriales cyanobacterium SM2_2_1]|nr:hypothetical protein [Oscillatoriales cyanobacterium SM2_2_1]